MRRARILEVVGNSEGGGARIVGALIAAVDARHFELGLVAPEAESMRQLCAQHGATFHPLPLMSSRTSLPLLRRLRAAIRELRPDIVHAHGTRAAWFVDLCLGNRADRPAFIYSEHLFSFDARTGPRRLAWLALERHLCRRADALTTSCRTNARYVAQSGWIDPVRIPLDTYGIPLDEIRAQVANPVPRASLDLPNLSDHAHIVGTVARMVPQKGLEYLLDAVPLVLAEYPDTHVLVVGDGPLRERLTARIHRLGIAAHVRFLGAHAQPWRLLAHADVVALPSLYEGLPAVTLEAFAAGLPVVATRVGGNPEVVVPGHNGVLVPPRDAPALAQSIVSLLRDPAARLALSSAGREMVREYDLRASLSAFVALYEQVATQRGLSATDSRVHPAPACDSTRSACQ